MILLRFEQALILLLILGRWLLPRGKMSLPKFSDMLLVYFGMSVDILDFLTQGVEIFRCSVGASQIVLLITAISLVQFTLDIELMVDKFDNLYRKQSIFTLLGIQEIMKYPPGPHNHYEYVDARFAISCNADLHSVLRKRYYRRKTDFLCYQECNGFVFAKLQTLHSDQTRER